MLAKGEEFRRPIIASKNKKESPAERKTSMQMSHRQRRSLDIQRKTSVCVLGNSLQEKTVNKYYHSTNVLPVPKILLQPIKPSDLKNSNSSTPGNLTSGCCSGTDPAPGPPKVKEPSRLFSPLESTAEETKDNRELEETDTRALNRTGAKSSLSKLPEVSNSTIAAKKYTTQRLTLVPISSVSPSHGSSTPPRVTSSVGSLNASQPRKNITSPSPQATSSNGKMEPILDPNTTGDSDEVPQKPNF